MNRLLAVVIVLARVGLGHANQEITVDLTGGVTMEFVWVDSGVFMMGSPDSDILASGAEKPQHQVTISQGFYLGKTEISQGQWVAVMGTMPWSGQSYVQENPNNPAVYISWNDVQGFIHKLNQATGDSLYRLPTGAEWEYACRAGATTRWSFGDDESQLGQYGWYEANAWNAGLQYGQPVGTKLPNLWGLYDMHGNVWEWVQDWFGNYSSAVQVDPKGPDFGSARVFRGGSFIIPAQENRSASLQGNEPDIRAISLGARLARKGSAPGTSTSVAPQRWGEVKGHLR